MNMAWLFSWPKNAFCQEDTRWRYWDALSRAVLSSWAEAASLAVVFLDPLMALSTSRKKKIGRKRGQEKVEKEKESSAIFQQVQALKELMMIFLNKWRVKSFNSQVI